MMFSESVIWHAGFFQREEIQCVAQLHKPPLAVDLLSAKLWAAVNHRRAPV